MTTPTLRFFTNCVNWPPADVRAPGGLRDMIDNEREITRTTFLRHVDRADLRDLETMLGYSTVRDGGLTMRRDWAVGYRRSKLHGQRCYYFVQSAIEYVFTQEATP